MASWSRPFSSLSRCPRANMFGEITHQAPKLRASSEVKPCQILVCPAANPDASVGALRERQHQGSPRVGFFFPQLLIVDFDLVARVRGQADHEGLFLIRAEAVGVAIPR